MRCELCTLSEIRECTFVVILTHDGPRWLFSRHRERTTWETQGGHIDPGETPPDAARRELYEESGVIPASMIPLCGYWSDRGEGRRYGMLFLAEVARHDPLPESEIAEVQWFDGLPGALTYPDITPKLFARAQAYLQEGQ